MTTSASIKRRGLIVPHPVQKKLFIRITWVLLVLLIFSGGLFYIFAQQRLEDEYFKAHSQIKTTMEMLLPWMLAVYSIGILAASVLTLLISRRLAGPMVNFKRTLQQIDSGDLKARVTLRKDDEYRELADLMNKFFDHIASDFAAFESSFSQIDEYLQSLDSQLQEKHSQNNNYEATRKLVSEAKERLAGRKI